MPTPNQEPLIQHNFRLTETESRLGLIVAQQNNFDKVAPFAAHLVRSSIVDAAEDGTIKTHLDKRVSGALAEQAALDATIERLTTYLESLREKRQK